MSWADSYQSFYDKGDVNLFISDDFHSPPKCAATLTAYQFGYGSDIESIRGVTSTQLREIAAAFLAAADELDRRNTP